MNHLRLPALVFLTALVLLLIIVGHRFVPTHDEGIILHSSQRMVEGARPYADFFGYMSPGSYWLQAAVFRVFGLTYLAGRLPVIFGFALQCALLFWLAEFLASRRTAWAAVSLFAGFQIADPSFLTAQHRWDSATFAFAGLCSAAGFTASTSARARTLGIALAGALLGAAAWCTPSIALTGLVVALWLLASQNRRALLLPFAAGVAATTTGALLLLASSGILGHFLRQMQWLSHNYSGVNIMSYGSVMGGYGKLLEGATTAELPVRLLILFGMAMPAILPPVALLSWAALLARKKVPSHLHAPALLLLAATVTLVASAFPRADLMHLAFVAALPYALAATGIAWLLPPKPAAILSFALLPLSLLFFSGNLVGLLASRPIESPVGRILVPPTMAPEIEKLHANVRPGQSLFVYPYMPVEYFLTQTRNPTRFPYLGPGMMTSEDEAGVLAELQANPPQWLLYLEISDEEMQRVFPSAIGREIRFRRLEQWLMENYRIEPRSKVVLHGYQLYQRRPSQTAALTTPTQ